MVTKNLSIITEGLTKSFGSVKAVNGLDLRIPVGTRFALLGPNGAGKTTTVRMLSGLMKPTRGSASVFGYDIVSQKDEVKTVTGLLPETPGLYSKLSATEFLEFIGALNRLHGEFLYERIDSLLSILGLEGRRNDLLESYSSGMKQKVLIASTLLHEPRVVFLDEPTSRLDPSASVLVKEMILVLAEETNTTFFICTHMTDFAQDICDIIGILNEGELVTVGPPDAVIEAANAFSLEDAYLKIVGGKVDREALLSWR
ncbi:MAG: ABC transporter ATP-binding protein [Candidatus Thorarchaeota archaeon]|jgi:ABC-2 type transport system ATP-binding protein